MDTTVHNPAAAFANVRQGSFEVKPEEIEYFEKIGEGAMAVIYRAKMRNLTCAAKKLKNSTRTDSQVLRPHTRDYNLNPLNTVSTLLHITAPTLQSLMGTGVQRSRHGA